MLLSLKKAGRSRGRTICAAMMVSGTIVQVVVPEKGQRFAVVRDDFGDSHQADVDQLTAA